MIVQELHHIQERHRWLPEVELRRLAERTGTPLSRLQEVASFFPHFHLQPPPAVEIRVCGLDQPGDCLVPGAQVPLLSALRPWPQHPAWDTAVWFDILSIPGTDTANDYYAELEQWIYSNYAGDYAGVRVEWSKGWGYTAAGAWTNELVVGTNVPASFTQGFAAGADFRAAVDMLDRLDPHRVFSTAFLDRLMPRSADLDANGTVDGADLAELLAAWGPQGGKADLNADGQVDGADLAELLARWGTRG